MKTFNELNKAQQTKAIAHALKNVVTLVAEQTVIMKFKSSFNSALFETIMISIETKEVADIVRSLVGSPTLMKEFMDMAVPAAMDAIYSEESDYVVKGVA